MKHKATLGSVLGHEAWGTLHHAAKKMEGDREVLAKREKKRLRREAKARRVEAERKARERRRPKVSANLRKHQQGV